MNRKQLTIEAELTLEELRFAEDLRGIVRSNLQRYIQLLIWSGKYQLEHWPTHCGRGATWTNAC